MGWTDGREVLLFERFNRGAFCIYHQALGRGFLNVDSGCMNMKQLNPV
jgi:hypothetical protein